MRYHELVEYKQDITIEKFKPKFVESFVTNLNAYGLRGGGNINIQDLNKTLYDYYFLSYKSDPETAQFIKKIWMTYALGTQQEYEALIYPIQKWISRQEHDNPRRMYEPINKMYLNRNQNNIDLNVKGLISQLESADPSNNKQYVLWMIKFWFDNLHSNSTHNFLWEDLLTDVATTLERFHTLKVKRRLPYKITGTEQNDLILPENMTIPADINKINSKNYKLLSGWIRSVYLQVTKKDQATAMPKGDAETVYEDNDVRVIIPNDKEAACYYGQGTRWCTAATGSFNYFDNYNKEGPLYILLPKKAEYDGEKYQLHIPSQMYMDETDSQVSLIKIFKDRFPNEKLRNFFRDAGIEFDKMLTFNIDNLDWVNDVIKEIFSWALVRFDRLLEDLEGEYYHEYMNSLEGDGYLNDEGEIKDDADPYSFIEWISDAYDGRYTVSKQQMDLIDFAENTELKDLVDNKTDFGKAYEFYITDNDRGDDITVSEIPSLIYTMLINHNNDNITRRQDETLLSEVADDINWMAVKADYDEGEWILYPRANESLTPIAKGKFKTA